MDISSQDSAILRALVKERSGISLGEDKDYLLSSRLLQVIRKHEIADFAALAASARAGQDAALLRDVIEAMTTNETSFFRDGKPFEYIRNDILPHLLQGSVSGKLRIWCAACSTGQEPYSLALTLLESKAKYPNASYEILGTDINSAVLERARAGLYTQFEVQRGLPVALLLKYFTQDASKEKWQIKDEVRAMARFETLNLLGDFRTLGKFDLIFCRNVLIYFEPPVKSAILNKLADCLNPRGALILGGAETITGLCDRLAQFQDANGQNLTGIFRTGNLKPEI